MADSRKSRLTRRTFLKGAGVATAAAVGPTIIVRSARAKSDTLKIGQWTHFVPAFDEWFDKKYCPERGAKNNVQVVADHISVNDLRPRAAAEVSAKKARPPLRFLDSPTRHDTDRMPRH